MQKVNITTDMEKEFLKAQIKNDGLVSKMAFTGEGIMLPAKDLYQAILNDLEELEKKKNEGEVRLELLKGINKTVSDLLKENKDYENTINKLQQVIVAQALRIVELQKGIVKLETTSK